MTNVARGIDAAVEMLLPGHHAVYVHNSLIRSSRTMVFCAINSAVEKTQCCCGLWVRPCVESKPISPLIKDAGMNGGKAKKAMLTSSTSGL